MSASNHPRPDHRQLRAIVSRLVAAFSGVVVVMLVASTVADARIGVPSLKEPRNKLSVQSLPAFRWGSVRRAASYQFEFSSVRNFSSGVAGFATGPIALTNTAISNDQTIPNGKYFWRVRAVSAKDVPGRWSPMRTLIKHWDPRPTLNSPVGTTINWPTSLPLFSWTAVKHAVNYVFEIGTDPSLAKLVYGPINVQGPQYVFPGNLAPDTYYWAVQPIDAAGQMGRRSKVQSFTLNWPSQTTLTESNVAPDTTYEEPSFSWTPIPGASSYEIEVSTLPAYPTNSVILDSTGLIGTQYTAKNFFPNHTTLYWRLRAIDARGDAGTWNDGQPFTEGFDQQTPTIQNLHVYDASGNVATGAPAGTSDPILRWSPVPGASEYQITLAVWSSGSGCNYNGSTATIDTPATAWTPGGNHYNPQWESTREAWPGNADGGNSKIYFTGAQGTAVPVCVDLVALRNDGPLAGSTIKSAPTLLGDSSAPAFTYDIPASGDGSGLGTSSSPTQVTYSPGVVPPEAGSGPVPAGSTVATTPLFEWQPVPSADGYYVIIANDQFFDPNSIVTGGYTNTTSWQSTVPLKDQSSSYWWEVIPVSNNPAHGDGAPIGDPEIPSNYNPQPFNKSSNPPTPVSPTAGANVPTQPTFSWHSAQAAQNYTLEIATDPSFASPIDTETTDSTSYTSTSTLPPGKTLYWRVRANDVANNLNWSATQTFTHNLPAPAALHSRPATGSPIPLISWASVTGAVAYNLQVTNGGRSSVATYDTPYMTPQEFLGPGINHLQVQSVFPGGLTSAFSNVATFDRTIPAPKGLHAVKKGSLIIVTWRPDSIAKAYTVQLSTTPGFSSTIASDTTSNTVWVPQISATDAALKLYWRIAVVDYNGSTGAWHNGVFGGHTKHKHKKRK